jgi:hypothetical protein
MIEGLDNLLEDTGQPGLAELRGLLQELLGERAAVGRVVSQYRHEGPTNEVPDRQCG